MAPIKGHYDGTSIVLDEPVTLHVGQAVRVVIVEEEAAEPLKRGGSRFGFAKGIIEFEMADDFNDTPEDFAEYM